MGAEDKTSETSLTSNITPDSRVESVTQYLDEMNPAEAMAKMKAFVVQQKELRTMGRGQWFWPPSHKHMEGKGDDGKPLFRCIRLGTLTDLKRKAHIEAQQYVLIAQGWKKCPPGMRFGPC